MRDASVFIGLLRLFALQLFGEGFLLHIHNLAASHRKIAVSRHAYFHITQRHRAELFLKIFRIITLNHIPPGQLQHAVIDGHGAKGGIDLTSEQSFTSARSAAQQHAFTVAARFGGDDHRDTVLAAAHTQIAVMHDNRQRVPGHMQSFTMLPQTADRTQEVELLKVALLQTINLRQAKQGPVGQLHIRHAF